MPNIELSGFKDIDQATLSIIDSKIEKFVNKVNTEDFHLGVNLKIIHEKEKSEIYELTANFKKFKHVKGVNIKISERDLIKAVNMLFSKLERMND